MGVGGVPIGVRNLTTGEYAGAGDDVRHVSASSAKAIWVAAALAKGADVSDIARPIFRDSNNELSGVAIDRAGGPDAVNEFMWNVVGMERSCPSSPASTTATCSTPAAGIASRRT